MGIFEFFDILVIKSSGSDGTVTACWSEGQRFNFQVRQNFFNLLKRGIEPKGEQEEEEQQQQLK